MAVVTDRLAAAIAEASGAWAPTPAARPASAPPATPATGKPAPAGHQASFVAPRTPVEETLARIWREILKKQSPIGIYDDFFALGGDSVLATLFVSRVKDAFSVDMPVLTFFEKPTVADTAMEVVARKAAQASQDDVNRMLADLEQDAL